MDIELRHNGSKAGKSFAAAFAEASRRQQDNAARCIAMLRSGYDVAIIHPDDGWVDRGNSTFSPSYPLYQRQAKVGDLIALGWPTCDERVIGNYRIVRVTGVRPRVFSTGSDYAFEPYVDQFEMTAPEPAPLYPA